MNVVMSIGFILQYVVDAYISGTLVEFIYEIQRLDTSQISAIIGNSYLSSVLPTLAAVTAFHLSQSFLRSVLWGTAAAMLILIAQFAIIFWNQPYEGSVGLSAVVGLLCVGVTCFVSRAIVGEFQHVKLLINRSTKAPFWTLGQIGLAGVVIAILIPSLLYYGFVYPLLKPADATFGSWSRIMVTGSLTWPVQVALFGENRPQQPSIPFQNGLLEEEAQRDPFIGEPKSRARIQLHFANVERPSYSLAGVSGLTYVKGAGPSAYRAFTLSVVRFNRCTPRDLSQLSDKLLSGKIGTTVPVPRSAVLEFKVYQSWIFVPQGAPADLDVMLPAWNDNTIHLMPVTGGAHVGAQEPLTEPGRALLIGNSAIHLAVTTSADFVEEDDLSIVAPVDNRSTRIRDIGTITCPERKGRNPQGKISWNTVAADDHVLLAGYVVNIRDAGENEKNAAPHALMMRIENPDKPTILMEKLTVGIATDRGPVGELLTGVEAQAVTVSNFDTLPFDGKFDGAALPKDTFTTVKFFGEKLLLKDDPNHSGGLRLKGRARNVYLDDQQYYRTFAGHIIEPVTWTIAGLSLTSLMGLLVIIWRRVPKYSHRPFAIPRRRSKARRQDP